MRATVGAGRASDLFPGARVVWMHPRRGDGPVRRVDARVVSCSRRPVRVEIEVRSRGGGRYRRTVGVDSLRWRR